MDDGKLTVGSLFSGIGGLEYGLEQTGGFKTIWNCEIEAYPSAVLRKHWSDVPNLGDITKVDWNKVAKPDLICGGFPCQDISVAGKGAGIKEGTRSGLWSEFAKAIRILRPRYALIENVPILANRGLNIVLADLAETGYDAEWHNISAASVGAWHKRERIFIIAYPVRGGCDGGECDRKERHLPSDKERNVEKTFERRQSERESATGKVGDVPDTECLRHDGRSSQESMRKKNAPETKGRNNEVRENEIPNTDSQGLQGGKNAGNPESGRTDTEQLVARQSGKTRAEIWAAEPNVGRVADGVPSRVDRIKCLGNAVVPQVVEVVGEMILKMEKKED